MTVSINFWVGPDLDNGQDELLLQAKMNGEKSAMIEWPEEITIIWLTN